MADGQAGSRFQVLSIIAFVLLVLAIVALVYRHALFASHLIGQVVQVLALLLMVWARLTLGLRSFQPAASPTAGDLVTNGPYRFVRHPIYAAIFYFLIAGLTTHPGATNALITLLAFAGLAARMISEERLLIAKYPGYTSYAACTKRVIPYLL